MATLICGSLAFDTIMTFEGRFAEQILPDQLHILNVSFLVPGLRRDFGGCAGNIAYAMRQLGGVPLPVAALGNDGADYLDRLGALGIGTEFVRQIQDTYTAQAMIMTDRDNNQITAFHPGAMMQAHLTAVEARPDVKLGIISPDGRDAMLQHAEQFKAAGIPFVFDPGQGLPMFSGDELLDFMGLADYACFNDYEARLLTDRTGRSLDQLAGGVKALVVTRGGEGSTIHADGQRLEIPCVQASAIVDPTGCGDAYRSGLLYGIANGLDWLTTGRLAAVMGAIKIAHRGGQSHQPSRAEIGAAYEQAFGARLW